jgi:ParB-like chromosome segregation protein Spo0J
MTDPRIRKLEYLPVSDLKPDPRNPRKHGHAQIRALAKSIKSFDFAAPILVDRQRQVIAGHGRLEAAKLLGLEQVSVVCLDHLTETQARGYQLADNKLTDRSSWDEERLARHLKELSELVIEFDIEDTGFELPEIDLLIQGLDDQPEADSLDEFQLESGPAVTRHGDVGIRRQRGR